MGVVCFSGDSLLSADNGDSLFLIHDLFSWSDIFLNSVLFFIACFSRVCFEDGVTKYAYILKCQ